MFYDSVCLNGTHGQLIWVLVLECDDFEDCDVIRYRHVTSSITSPIDVPKIPMWSLLDMIPLN